MSSLPNIVNDGVRFGSLLTMCSVDSSTGSAKLTAIGTFCPLLTYGSLSFIPAS